MNNKNNAITLKGRLVSVPKLNTTKAGVPVTSFTIAVDRQYKAKGERKQDVCAVCPKAAHGRAATEANRRRKADFFTIVCWRANAEYVCKHCSKGSMILVNGEMQSHRHPDKNGNELTWYEVVADHVFTAEKCDSDLIEPVIPEVNGISNRISDENTSS